MKKFMAALLLLFLWPIAAQADTVQENFNELKPGANATNLGAFSVTGGSVDIVGGTFYGYLCVAPGAANCVDMDGSTGAAGQISTGTLTLTPGTYQLSFDLLGSQRGNTTSTTVTLGSLYNQTFVLGSTDDTSGVVSVLLSVSSLTTVPLVFTSNDASPAYSGALLDNVDLKQISVPEPATMSLLAVGLAGLMIRRKRASTSR